MSYNKRTWANGDLITKERMNNIEDGIYDAHDKINAINNKVEENTTDTNTARQDISDIKLQIGTEELTTTSKKIKGAINDLSSQIKEIENSKTDKTTTANLQQQINNLVLGAVGDGNNAEVIQARGEFNVLNDRLDDIDNTLDDIENTKVGFNKMDRPLRTVLNSNMFTVNFQDLKVYVNHNMNYIVGTNNYEQFNGSTKLSDIDIPEDAINETVYMQYTFWYDSISGVLKFTPSAECPKDNSIVFGFFYHGKPFLSNYGDGIEVIDKKGNVLTTSFIDVDEKIKNKVEYACIFDGKLNIDSVNKKITLTNVILVYSGVYYWNNLSPNKELSWADFGDSDYTVNIWFDSVNNDIVLTKGKDLISTTQLHLICSYYNNKIINCLYPNNIYINDRRATVDFLSNTPEISTKKLKNPLRTFVHDDTLEVNFKDMKVYVKVKDNYFITEYNYVDCRKLDGSKLDDINIPAEALTDYNLYMLWLDYNARTLNFTNASNVPADAINFGLFYRGKPYLNNIGNGIKVINPNGDLTPTRIKDISSAVSHVIFYVSSAEDNSISIDYDTENYTITATTKPYWILFENGGVKPSSDKTFTIQLNTLSEMYYAYKLYINMDDGTPLILSHNAKLAEGKLKTYAFVCAFLKGKLLSPSFDPGCILIDGSIPDVVNGLASASGSYDWNNNRFVLPSDLYLVKNIPYSISACDFNMKQLKDNDECLFEITLPTKVVQFEQTADISIPYAYDHPFRTRIAGKYKKSNSLLTQDISLHVADPAKITKKDITVLCIGDSITYSNFPKHLKWHLSQMGINATMIGTVTCSHEFYSYGISQYLDAELGEGRGGWRLTDFTCNTPLKDGGYYVNSSFPMMNPETGKFDFSYYMTQQGFSGVDFVVINLGANDISGYHYAGNVDTNPAYGTIRKVDLDTEYLNPENEYYLGKLYKTLIDSIHAYNSDIKIAINPPMGAGDSSTIVSAMKWAEICQYEFKDTTNVYNLASYASQAQLSATNIEGIRPYMTQVNSKNNTYKFKNTPDDVHYNGMGQLIHTLYPASWIVNMCL